MSSLACATTWSTVSTHAARLRADDARAGGSRSAISGISWSLSLSHALTQGIRPYVRTGASRRWSTASTAASGSPPCPNALNIAELREVGIKASLLDDRLSRRSRRSARRARRFLRRDGAGAFHPLAGPRDGGALGRHTPARVQCGRRPAESAVCALAHGAPRVVNSSVLRPRRCLLWRAIAGHLLVGRKYTRRSGYPDLSLNLGATCLIHEAPLAESLPEAIRMRCLAGRIRDITLPSGPVFGAALFTTRRTYVAPRRQQSHQRDVLHSQLARRRGRAARDPALRSASFQTSFSLMSEDAAAGRVRFHASPASESPNRSLREYSNTCPRQTAMSTRLVLIALCIAAITLRWLRTPAYDRGRAGGAEPAKKPSSSRRT